MQALVQETYGSAEVMHITEIDKPEIGDNEVLLRVRAAGVNPADWAIMSGLPVRRPPRLRPAQAEGRHPGNGCRGRRRGHRLRRHPLQRR